MSQPSPEAIGEFIAAYEKLAAYEANMRHLRGWGAFTTEEIASFPVPACVEVYKWLKGLCDASVQV